jgi:hypothetical protein
MKFLRRNRWFRGKLAGSLWTPPTLTQTINPKAVRVCLDCNPNPYINVNNVRVCLHRNLNPYLTLIDVRVCLHSTLYPEGLGLLSKTCTVKYSACIRMLFCPPKHQLVAAAVAAAVAGLLQICVVVQLPSLPAPLLMVLVVPPRTCGWITLYRILYCCPWWTWQYIMAGWALHTQP